MAVPDFQLVAISEMFETLKESKMEKISEVNEKDWKLFRSRIWHRQEAYMDRPIHEYIDLLNGQGSASSRFWELEKRIREDKKDSGVHAMIKRSNMKFILMNLLDEEAISLEDLEGFSDDLKDTMSTYVMLSKKREKDI